MHTNELTGAMDMVKRDRFELLSAYLDGEVTATERKQVQEWLDNDESVKQLYARLLRLRQGVLHLPIPQSQATEATVQQVMGRLRRRSRMIWICGGSAIAATIISVVSGFLPNNELGTVQFAQQRLEKTEQSEPEPVVATTPLRVALNSPIIPIPKAAKSLPENSENSRQPQQHTMVKEVN